MLVFTNIDVNKQIYDVPMSAINRPIPSQLDKSKVENMKEVLQIPGREEELTPIVSVYIVYLYEKATHCL